MDIKSAGLSLASRLDVVRTAAAFYDTTVGIPDLPKVDDKVSNYNIPEGQKKGEILIPVVQGRRGFGSFKDCLIAHAFRIRGYEPVVLLCDADLDMCFAKRWAPNEKAACDVCCYIGESLFERFGLDPIRMDEIGVDLPNSPTKKEHKGVPVQQYAIASSRAYQRKYHIDPNDETTRRFRNSALYLTDVADKVISQHEFDAVITNDSGYLIGGVFLHVANNKGIPAWDVDVGFRPQTLLCGNKSRRSSLPTYPCNEVVQNRLKRSLSENEKSDVEKFMADRMAGEEVRFNHAQLASKRFTPNTDSTVYGAFTNLPWDASLTATEEAGFKDVFDWLDRTIDIFTSNNSILYIKTHPAEALRETNESIYNWILDNYSLPNSINLLKPETEINPYEFMNNIDVGLVWNSTAGLEMSYLGKPVIVAGDTHYRGYGFTNDVDSYSEYKSLLTTPISELTISKEKAKRYCYHLFIERHISFPFYKSNDSNDDFNYLPVNHTDLTPGNKNIDKLVTLLLDDEVNHSNYRMGSSEP